MSSESSLLFSSSLSATYYVWPSAVEGSSVAAVYYLGPPSFCYLSSFDAAMFLESISLISLGSYFMSCVPARCMLSRMFSLPQARQRDTSFFCFIDIVVSGYLHF